MTPRTPKSSRFPLQVLSTESALSGILGAIAMCVIAGILVATAFTPIVAMSGMSANAAVSVFESLPDKLNPRQLAEPSVLYAKASDGSNKELAVVYDQDRETLAWDQIPQFVKDAVVSEEDPRFYSHGGVDVVASARAALQNLSGSGRSGASTITMQYVRNVLIQEALAIPDEKSSKAAYKRAMVETPERKLQEMRYAISVEKKYSKDEILLGYLNIALFGRKVYGIESAANYYFNKSAKDLTLAEAASLVATVNNPSNLQIDIPKNIKANKERRDNKILQSMLKRGKITQAQFDEAVATPIAPKITPRISGCNQAEAESGVGAFCDYVIRLIKRDPAFGRTPEERVFNFSRGGYKIHTTINLDMQAAALQATRTTVPAVMEGIDAGSATSSVEVGTGRVLTMAQNRPFNDAEDFLKKNPGYTTINYNTDSEDGGSSGFQTGSTFKPFILADWLRNGNSAYDYVKASGPSVYGDSFKASCSEEYGYEVREKPTRGYVTPDQLPGVRIDEQGHLIWFGGSTWGYMTGVCHGIELAESLGVHRASDQPTWSRQDVDFGLVGEDMLGKNSVLTLNGQPRDLTVEDSNEFGGIDEIAPITMASAFGAFAGNGTVCEPSPIDEILDANDKPVAFTKGKCTAAIHPEVAAGVAYALENTASSESASFIDLGDGVPHFAQPGTTGGEVDNWIVGASTRVAVATWVGNAGPVRDDNGDLSRVSTQDFYGPSGTSLMDADQEVWTDTMRAADAKYGGTAFPTPAASEESQQTAQIPDLKNRTYDEAAEVLTRIGFTPVDGGEIDSSTPPDEIITSNPAVGETVMLGSPVTVFSSNGRSIIEVPNGLVGSTGSSAEAELYDVGFSSVVYTCGSGEKPDLEKHRVTSVLPESGSHVIRDKRIGFTLDCSK